MPTHDIVVMGASAGGVEALKRVFSVLAGDLPAAVFVVQHIGEQESYLPEILSKAGSLPASHPSDREPIRTGRIYVAPPDHHILLEDGHVHISHGPRENRTRPAINPLFRSAALVYGPRVIGVILTGLLDDGVSGLWEIKRRGGIAIVQDPGDALYPSMPSNAIQQVPVDHVIAAAEIGPVISALVASEIPRTGAKSEPADIMEKTLSDFTCPECRGPLWEERKGNISDFRCRVGHAYSPLTMAQDHRDAEERALWAASLALEEGALIAERLAPQIGRSYLNEAQTKREQAAIIKAMLTRIRQNSVD